MIIAVLLFIICFCVITVLLSIPFQKPFERDFDTVVIGGSEAGWGISCPLIDGDETNAVNLAAAPALMQGRKSALVTAFSKYDVDTVIFELSCDVLNNDIDTWEVIGKGMIVPKIVTFSGKADYCLNAADIKWYEYDSIYGYYMAEVYKAWETVFKNTYTDYYYRAGSDYTFQVDVSLSPEDAVALYNNEQLSTDYSEKNITILKECLDLCKEKGVRLIVVTMPIPEEHIWRVNGMDAFREKMLDLLSGYDCEYYDFNLLKNRQELFNETESFRDPDHLSWIGCIAFSNLFKEEVMDKSPEEVDLDFYDTYEEVKQHSVYMKYMDE